MLGILVAISVVLIPGLAVRRQVTNFKRYRAKQLEQEKSKPYTDYKNFDNSEEDVIIARKKELSEKLNKIRAELKNFKSMRSSHIDGEDKDYS